MKTLLLLLSSFGFFMWSCTDDDTIINPTEEEIVADMITELRAATSSFHNIDAAKDAGWETDLSGCVEHPDFGGMGHHFANFQYFDGRTNHLEPQVLLYAMNEQHEMEFLGVEYIVPFEIVGPDETPPTLFFQDFHPNHEQGFWALHVWTEKNNSNGLFQDWNPEVFCQNWIDYLIQEVQDTTTEFHDFESGVAAGWNTPLSECVEHPELGGMGFHYGRLDFLDGRVNHLEPQVLLYNLNNHGEMEFLGVEYIVPFDIIPADATPPQLFNQPYLPNYEQQFWALHVWTEKHNPSGIFSNYNPDVSCSALPSKPGIKIPLSK